MYQGIIFDYNGTMFFDSQENEQAWRQFIYTSANREITDQEFQHQIHGRPNQAALEYFFNRSLTPCEVAELSEGKERIYRQLCLENADRFHLVEGLTELLDQLIDQQIPCAIATAAGKGNIDFYIEHFDLHRWFDPTKIIYDDGTFPGKPNPAIYLKTAKVLSIEPKSCIVIEDSLSGIEAAKKANIGRIMGISPTGEQDHLHRLAGIDLILSDFKGLALKDILQK